MDLVAAPILGAGVSNVATVLAELGEDSTLVGEKFSPVAALYPLAAVRRLGFLVETVDQPELAAPLFEIAQGRRRWRPDLLEPTGVDAGPLDTRWRLYPLSPSCHIPERPRPAKRTPPRTGPGAGSPPVRLGGCRV